MIKNFLAGWLVLCSIVAQANSFYSAPAGNGSGTITSPYGLQTALNATGAIHAGDTLYLRGGTYKGNYISTLNGAAGNLIVVKAYPGERVILDGTLAGQTFKNVTVLVINGSYTAWEGLEVTNSDPERTISISGSNPNERRGGGIDIFGPGVSVRNNLIYDVGQGISWWTPATNSECYGNVVWNNGWWAPDRDHGHGVYTQNNTGVKSFVNNVVLNNFSYGVHVYGSDQAQLNNYYFEGNVLFNDHNLIGGGAPLNNINFTRNYVYGDKLQFGYESKFNTNLTLRDNYFSGGLDLRWWTNVTARKNTIFNKNIYTCFLNTYFNGAYNYASFAFDSNFYHWSTPGPAYPPDISVCWKNTINDNEGLLTLAQWQALSQDVHATRIDWPASSSTTYALTGKKAFVTRNKYDRNRSTITIFNWDRSDTVNLDIDSVLNIGETYELHNTQDYFNDIQRGVYTGSIPVQMRSHSVAKPYGYATELEPSTFPEFGNFILIRPRVTNPYNLAVLKTSNGGVESLQIRWKPDRRDITVRNHITIVGSSTMAGAGASVIDSAIAIRLNVYYNPQAASYTMLDFALGGQSSRNWLEAGPNVDSARNVVTAINYQFNNSSLKDYPKIAIIQDASNWVVDGVSNEQNFINIRSIVNKHLEYGAQVFVVGPQPRNSYTAAQRARIEDFYTLLKQAYDGGKVPGVRFVGHYEAIVNPVDKSLKAIYDAGDLIHMNNAGHRILFNYLRNSIDSAFSTDRNIGLLRQELETSDYPVGPWASYNANVNKDTGYTLVPLSLASKYWRVRGVYANGDVTEWSTSVPLHGRGIRTNTVKGFTLNGQYNGFYEFLPDQYPQGNKKSPLIIFLHGAGEVGNGTTQISSLNSQAIPRLIAAGARMGFLNPNTQEYERFVVLSPQLPPGRGWTTNFVEPIMDYAVNNLNVDPKRIYLAGLSLGGGGEMIWLTSSLANASRVSAAVFSATICDGQAAGVCFISQAKVAVWSLIGDADFTGGGGVGCTNALIDGINACPGNTETAIKTIYPGYGHYVWEKTFDTGHTEHNPNVYEWMLTKVRGQAPITPPVIIPPDPPAGVDTLPTARAGTDETIPVGQTTVLNGAASTAKAGSTYHWDKVSGPSQYELLAAENPVGVIRNMVAGVYIYRLTIVDPTGRTSTDDTQITVIGPNQPPIARAGNDQNITSPASSITVDGSFSSDIDGFISSFAWTKVSGTGGTITTPASAITTITGLSTGSYKYKLTVTDNQGAAAVDTMTVMVSASGGGGVVKITTDYRRFWAEINNTFTARRLFDNDSSVPAGVGYGLISDTFRSNYDFEPEKNVSIKRLRMWDANYDYINRGMKFWGVLANGTWEYIGEYDGSAYNQWVTMELPTARPFKRIVMTGCRWDNFPSELEFYGTFTPFTEVVPPLKGRRLRDMFGVNTYEWNLIQDPIFPFVSYIVQEEAWDILKLWTHYRHYVDLTTLVHEEQRYTFSPTWYTTGSWALDIFYEKASSEGHEVEICMKALPPWIEETYPDELTTNRGIKKHELNPAKYGLRLDSAGTYKPQGDIYFQSGARYGQDSVAFSKLKVYTVPGQSVQVKRTGMKVVKWWEAENERDKSWYGRLGYQYGREYAAFLSAIYDGDMGKLGDTIGLKNASKKNMLCIGGMSNPLTDWFRGILEWCHENRNDSLPFDAVAYHDYSSNGTASQGAADATQGEAPEIGFLPEHADDWVHAVQVYAHKYILVNGRKIEVRQTEHGIDTDVTSPLYATPIGSKNTFDVQGDWGLRTMLLYWGYGFDRAYYFQMYDDGENTPGVFGTSGSADGIKRKRPLLDYVQQTTKIMGECFKDSTLSTFPRVWRGQDTVGGGKKYIGWMPTRNDSTANYTYTLKNPSYRVKLYTLTKGQSDAVVTFLPAGATVSIPLTETPVMWEEIPAIYSIIPPVANAGPNQTVTLPLAYFKNPTATLHGSGTDNDGAVEYQWRKVSGPGHGFLYGYYRPEARIFYEAPGTHVYELTVIDKDGRKTTSTTTLQVNNAPGNTPPIARAGNDTVIYAPNNYFFLDGARSSDPNGPIFQYAWSKIQGPSWGAIKCPECSQGYIYNLLPGSVYKFELMVTDEKGAIGVDTIQVTLLNNTGTPVNIPPVASAGVDKILTLPANSVLLDGSGSYDTDGNLIAYQWSQLVGPSTATISNPSAPAITVSGLTEGTYQFKLTITDNSNATAASTVVVVVNRNPESYINKIPTNRKKIVVQQ